MQGLLSDTWSGLTGLLGPQRSILDGGPMYVPPPRPELRASLGGAQQQGAMPPAVMSQDGRSMYIGVNHDGPLRLPPQVAQQAKQIGGRSGYYYEGGGGDREKANKALGSVPWRGSWDNLTRSDSPDFYYALFSNSREGTDNLINRVADPRKSIFDALVGAGDSAAHEALKGRATPQTLAQFLASGGFLEQARSTPATPDALRQFIGQGEAATWGDDGRPAPTPSGEAAARANEARLSAIANRPGVYFVGQDHLPSLLAMERPSGGLLGRLLSQQPPQQ